MSQKTMSRSADVAVSGGPADQRLVSALTLAAMSLGYGVVQLDVTIVNVAINSIGASFGSAVAGLQWVVSAYTIAFASFILSAGALGDRVGAKRVFMAGFAVFTLASLGCALAPSMPVLIGSRALQGLGAAVLVPNSLALLNHAYPDDEARGRAVGTWAAGASIALTTGPLVGGGLIEAFGWRSIFLVNLPIGLLGLWLVWRYATDTPEDKSREVDFPGQITAVVALGVLAGALIEGGAAGWTNRWVLFGFGAAAALAGVFIVLERRSTQPMLPLGLFRERTFSATSAGGLLVNIAFYGLIFVFSLYFQRVNDLSVLWTGLAFVPMTAACFGANLIAGRVSGRIGARTTIMIGSALMAAACLALLPIDKGVGYVWQSGPFLVMGAGLGLLVPPLTFALLGSVDKARSGIASGVLNASRQAGSLLGVALFGSFLASSQLMIHGARMALAISAGLLIAACVVVFAGVGRRVGAPRRTRPTLLSH